MKSEGNSRKVSFEDAPLFVPCGENSQDATNDANINSADDCNVVENGVQDGAQSCETVNLQRN